MVAELVEGALFHFNEQRYRLYAWVIMPNHVHVLFLPLNGCSMSKIVGSWKSFTSKKANQLFGRRGKFWKEDYYDRFIRDADHFHDIVTYIELNPVKAGLCGRPEDWRFGSARLKALEVEAE
jgi:REP element-mobilizing transposase RayT